MQQRNAKPGVNNHRTKLYSTPSIQLHPQTQGTGANHNF
jgi:hypothetical protein